MGISMLHFITLLVLAMTVWGSESFREKFFESWGEESRERAALELARLLDDVRGKEWYGENLMPIKSEPLVEKAGDSTQLKEFQNGVTVQNADLRALPTKKPFFKNPSLAGEGYPFDYLQNSRVYISTPVKILYETKDGEYYFVKSSVGYGWIDVRTVAFVDRDFEERFMREPLVTPIDDKIPLYDTSSFFVERLNLGTALPKGYYPIRMSNGFAALAKYKENSKLREIPIAPLVDEVSLPLRIYSVLGEPYGWGGYLDNRDCSMFLRDIFFGYGILLPRNSAQQAEGYTDISALSPNEKRKYILQNARAFRTVLYLKGHIMLYAGVDRDGEILVAHDVWGIKSFEDNKEGRKMIGGVAITRVEDGKGELWFDDIKSSWLAKTIGIKDIY